MYKLSSLKVHNVLPHVQLIIKTTKLKSAIFMPSSLLQVDHLKPKPYII